jgi:hypothetical protein
MQYYDYWEMELAPSGTVVKLHKAVESDIAAGTPAGQVAEKRLADTQAAFVHVLLGWLQAKDKKIGAVELACCYMPECPPGDTSKRWIGQIEAHWMLVFRLQSAWCYGTLVRTETMAVDMLVC